MNVRSLTVDKFFELKQFILEKNVDLFAITESWLHKNSPFHLYEIENYDIFHNCREGTRGGGCLVWVKHALGAKILNYQVIAHGSQYEQMVLKVLNFIVLVFYNPPTADINVLMRNWDEVLINECSSQTIPLIIGDINGDCESQPLRDYLYARNIRNYQSGVTRINRILDVLISFRNLHTVAASACYELAFSDHLPVQFRLNLQTRCTNNHITFSYSRNYSEFTFLNFNDALSRASWDDFNEAIGQEDVDNANEIFCSLVLSEFRKLAPVIIRREKHGVYLPLELRRWMKERNRMLRLSYRNPQNEQLRDDLRRIRNFVKSMRRVYEKDKLNRKFDNVSNDPKKTWNLLNNLMGRKRKDTICEVSADALNTYFCAPKEWSDVTPITIDSNGVDSTDAVGFHELINDDIFMAIARVKGNKAAGLDGVTNKILKIGKFRLAPKIKLLFNAIITSGKFPLAWKRAKVVTIYKRTGEKTDPANYRPISLLSCLSKLFEVCIYKQLYPVIEPHLPRCQHAFRKGHSITTALFEITDNILSSMEQKKLSYILQIDIKKAYDTVNPYLLLQRILNVLKINRAALALFEGYLFNRKLITSVNGKLSNEDTVLVGVPQGGVLPPILFIFFLAEIENLPFHGRLILYADDVQLIYTCDASDEVSIENFMNDDVTLIIEFLRSLHMVMNCGKTVITRFGTRQQLAKVNPEAIFNVANHQIKVQGEARNLGLFLDENLSFRSHLNNVSKSCSKTLYHLKAIRPYITETNAKKVVESLVISKVRLFLPITMTSTLKEMLILQKIINHSVRVIHELRKYDSIREYRTKYKWGDITELANEEFKKILTNMQLKTLSYYMNNLIVCRNYNARTRRVFYHCERAKNKSGERCLKYRATSILNH